MSLIEEHKIYMCDRCGRSLIEDECAPLKILVDKVTLEGFKFIPSASPGSVTNKCYVRIKGYIEEDKATAARCVYRGEQTYCYTCVCTMLKAALDNLNSGREV